MIAAKVNNRKLKCKVTVKDNRQKKNTTSHERDYFKSSWINPTCDLDGKVNYCCSICYDKYTEVIPATGHKYVKVSQSIESFTGKSVIKNRCSKCDRKCKRYSGPLIDYKKAHIHCHCGMDFNDDEECEMHHFYAVMAIKIFVLSLNSFFDFSLDSAMLIV